MPGPPLVAPPVDTLAPVTRGVRDHPNKGGSRVWLVRPHTTTTTDWCDGGSKGMDGMAGTDWRDLSWVMAARGREYERARHQFLERRPELVNTVAAHGLRLHGGRLPDTVTRDDLRVWAEQALEHLLDALRLHGTDMPIGWAVLDFGDMAARTAAGPAPDAAPDEAGHGADDITRFLVRWAAPLVRRSLEVSEKGPVGCSSRGAGAPADVIADRVLAMPLGGGCSPLSGIEAAALREEFLAKVTTGRTGHGAGALLRLAWESLTANSQGAQVPVTRAHAYELGFGHVREMAEALEMVEEAAASTARNCTRRAA